MTAESDLRAVTEQLRYLADELEAQQEVLELVPEPLRTAEPIPERPSIARLYAMMLAQEASVHAPVCAYLGGLDNHEPALPNEDALLASVEVKSSLESVIAELRGERLSLVAALEMLPESAWAVARPLGGESVTLVDFAYHMTQNDVGVLRRITQRLYEGQLGSPRVRPQ